MRLPIFLLLPLALAACVPAASPPAEAPPPPSVPPPPVPPPPPEGTAFLAGPEPVLQPTGDPRLDAWIRSTIAESGPAWRPFLLRAFAPVRANPLVLQTLEAEPADPAAFVRRYVTPARVAEGRRLYTALHGRPLFQGDQTVPTEYLIALWGMLADYGVDPPPFDMIEAIANAAAYGRASAATEFQLFHAVHILAEGRIPRARLTAYADGRIGEVRWLPDQYRDWREDGDGDGTADVWDNRADILRNLQRTLAAWEGSVPAFIEVLPPDPANPRMATPSSIALAYLRSPDGRPWPEAWRSAGGELVRPFGEDGPLFLTTRNATPLNHASPFRSRYGTPPGIGFAFAAQLLADRIAGRPGPRLPDP
ncbi:MAG: lytic murein transglycosylase [Allosphingosinicella sp.]|uniref:lytic murein transglycosylase n=1 Tax=Allosphingosinicella sp. TaxID=2823234 RepID=UPI00394F50DA